ncbi:MAG: ribosome-associated translation inhibitor RaiA [Pseudomonadota bacterium]
MQLTVHGKQMDVGDALRTHVSEKLEDINNKYFNRAIDATVTLAPEGHAFTKTHISIRVGKDIMVMSNATETDPYISFDAAAEKVAKQLRRYKKMLRDHHQRLEETPEAEIMKARDYVLATTGPEAEEQDNRSEDVPEGDNPVVIADMVTNIQTMTVSEAVMRLDLSGQNALMFRNPQHDGLNMVYRREDGNVGWVDPEGNNNS